MTSDDFREMALAMHGAVERSHMKHPDFRANGRIFASIMPGEVLREQAEYEQEWRRATAILGVSSGRIAEAERELDAQDDQPCLWTWLLSWLGGWSRERREFYKQGRK